MAPTSFDPTFVRAARDGYVGFMLNFGAVNGPFTKRLIDWASSGAPSIQMDMSWVDRALRQQVDMSGTDSAQTVRIYVQLVSRNRNLGAGRRARLPLPTTCGRS